MEKNYSYSHINMLTGGGVLVKNLQNDLTEFSARNPKYTQAFVDTLKQRVKDGLKLLATDKLKAQKDATDLVESIFTASSKKVAELNVDIKFNFNKDKARAKSLRTLLGFSEHLKKVQKGDQESLVTLLLSISENITDVRTEIETKGTQTQLIDDIIAFAAQLNDANITQESLKGASPEITAAQQEEFNDIHSETAAIAGIGKSIFDGNTAKQQQYSYARIIRNL